MMKEILKYAQGFNAKDSVVKWLNEKVTEDKPQGEVEHIIDYMVNTDKDSSEKSYNRMVKDAKKWMEKLNKKGEGIKEVEGEDVEVVKKWRDGFRFVKLISENAYKREGFLMNHCVSSYYEKDDVIYSLRDKNNKPHATLSSNSMQIKGYGNGSIHPKYIEYNVKMLEKLGLKVRDSEMKNLGYINVEEFKKHLSKKTIKSLFDGKYHYLSNKLLDKESDEFACFELWDKIPLIEFNKKNVCNINFNLNSFNTNAIKFLWNSFKGVKKNKKDKAKNASSGDSAKNASSGDYAQNASSGYYAKNASSGDYAKNASSGDYAIETCDGKNSVCASIGKGSKIKATKGTWITLAEYDKDNNPICVKSAQIDGVKLKENVFYELKNKRFVKLVNEVEGDQ